MSLRPEVYGDLFARIAVLSRPASVVPVTSWQDAELAGTWADAGGTERAAQFKKDALGFVHLRGTVTQGTGLPVAGSTVFTLPAGYRPTSDERFTVAMGLADSAARLDVKSDGRVIFVGRMYGLMDVHVPVAAVVLGADLTSPVVACPVNGKIIAVGYVPAAAITGADTHTRKVTLFNRGPSGSGSTAAASLQFNAGVSAAAFDERAITLDSDANRAVAAGEVLAWESLHVGNGIADPGGLVHVQVDPYLTEADYLSLAGVDFSAA